MGDNREFAHSPLSGEFTRGDITVDVEIYRTAGTQDPWDLAVVSLSGGCIRWHERYATEQDAYQAFITMVEAGGITSFTGVAPPVQH